MNLEPLDTAAMPPTATEKLRAVEAFAKAMSEGDSGSVAARRAGYPLSTLMRWRARNAAGGEAALEDAKSTGRPAAAGALTEEMVAKLRSDAIKTRSVAMAIKVFADSELCPPELAETIRAAARAGKPFPPSLIRAARYTPEQLAMHKGPKAMDGLRTPSVRGATVVFDDGTEAEITPGDLWELDDMSWNQPYWSEVEAGQRTRNGTSEKLADKHGCALNRQSLICRDVRSGKFLGCELVARASDGYTAVDIVRFLRRLMGAWGRPRIGFRLERGTWASGAVSAGADDEAEQAARGLEALGFRVIRAWRSQTKGGLEGSFAPLQKWESILGDGPDIGRVRGEMERATALVRRCQGGAAHPREHGFPHISDKLATANACMEKYNADFHHGRIVKGVPDELWNAAVQARPLAPMSERDLVHLLPERRTATLRGGAVVPKIAGQTTVFLHEALAQYGTGYAVQIAFDPEDVALGCAVFDDETEARRRLGSKRGDLLALAAWEAPAPQIAPAGYDVNGGLAARKAIHRIHRAAFVATGLAGRTVVERRGAGSLPREERGGPAEPLQVASAAPAETFSDPDFASWMREAGAG